jgi:hypothetical protein
MPVVLNKVITPRTAEKPKQRKQSIGHSHGEPKLSKSEKQRLAQFEEEQALKARYESYVDVPLGAILTLLVVAIVVIALSTVRPDETGSFSRK